MGNRLPGLAVRLTLDLELQQTADDLLYGHVGGLLLLNAENGEILVMASHPTYDPNQLEALWDNLVQDPQSPLLNRIIQGSLPNRRIGRSLLCPGCCSKRDRSDFLEASPGNYEFPR